MCLLKQFQDDFFYILVYLLGLRFKKAWLSSWFLTSWMEQQQRTQIRRWKATPNQKSTCSKSRLWPYSSERRHFASEHKRTMSLPMSGRRRSSPRRLFGIHNERTTRWDSCEVQAKTKCVSKSAADLEVMAVPWMCHVLWMCLSLCICSHFFAFIRDQQTWSLQVCTQLMLDSGQDYVDATVAVWCCVFFFAFSRFEKKRTSSSDDTCEPQYSGPRNFAPIFANYNQHVSGALQCIKRSGKRRCNRSRRRSSRDLRHDTGII